MSRRVFVVGLLVVAVCLLLAFFSPQPLYAHGAGLTLTATTSEYLVDIDYSGYSIQAEETGRFDFKLYKDSERLKSIDFDRVWVRIIRESEVKGGNTVFSGFIARPLFGSIGFSISLPKSGAYRMIVRYANGEDELAEATVPFIVEPPYRDPFVFGREFWYGIMAGGVGMFAIAGLSAFIVIRRRR